MDRFKLDNSEIISGTVYVSPHGLWVFVDGKEYFLAADVFERFKYARVAEVQEVFHTGDRLSWPKLNYYVELGLLESLEKFPAVYYGQ